MAHDRPVPAEAAIIDPMAFDGAAFDLDGVITRTATIHAAAWKEMFDAFLRARVAQTITAFQPFDLKHDYLRYVDGKPRYDGVRSFLASRGISLPDGQPDDPPERETVCGLGNRKNILFRTLLSTMDVQVIAGSVAFLRRARKAGMRTAVVSSSENTAAILASTGLSGQFDARIDGIEAARLHLKGKPAPDTFVHAAKVLDVKPQSMLGVEDSLAGVEAIRAAGFGLAIGLAADAEHAAALASRGANLVVRDLDAIRLQPARRGTASTSLPATPGSDPQWLLREDGFTLTREHEIESLFAIGNGYLGTRGSLAEGSRLSAPATFAAGVFDHSNGAPQVLISLPDWTHVSATVEGQRITLESGRNLEHHRILDMRQGILFREWRHQDAAGRVTHIRGLRLASMADRHLLIQSIAFAPENYSGEAKIDVTIGASITLHTTTGIAVAMSASTRRTDARESVPLSDALRGPVALRMELGQEYRLDRFVAIHTSRDPGEPAALARTHAQATDAKGLAALMDEHRHAWEAHWNACDIRIEGDTRAQLALRFAIYHLLSSANPDDDRVSIGARALTGAAYQGHVFWDTEIFMLPFFVLTCPRMARALLRYRHHTLPAARQRAQRHGYKGALYAWESATNGEDVTPPLLVQPGGDVVRVLTGAQEHHISADVAYAAWNYWRISGDRQFLLDHGIEILLETARFWASRSERGEDGRYHIRRVIGPDEYHETVDDNAYTNVMAKWNLEIADQLAQMIQAQSPQEWERISAQLKLDALERTHWSEVARELHIGLDPETGLIEQFRGYFELEDIDLSAFEHRTAPMDVLLGRERLQRSRIIKQPDVVMLLHLLPEAYPAAVRETNFFYYERRCAHGSSLSPAIHALVAARLGHTALAMRHFRQAMEVDLANNMGNAAGGVHAGALGGLWQATVFGFAGLEFSEDGPRLRPHLPDGWSGISLRVQWQGRSYELSTECPDHA